MLYCVVLMKKSSESLFFIALYLVFLFSYFCVFFSLSSSEKLNKRGGNAGCLIVNANNEFLMSKSSRSGKYHIPGGTSEPNEDSTETAKNETFEEIGVEVEIGDLFNYVKDDNFYLYFCTTKGDINFNYKLDGEVESVQWVNVLDADENTLRRASEYKFYAKRILQLRLNGLMREGYIHKS